jgi:hypothetical protein
MLFSIWRFARKRTMNMMNHRREAMTPVLTITEIEAQFTDQWVLVDDPQMDSAQRVQGGTVLAHSKDRDEVYRQAVALRPKRFAVLFTGQIPQDAAVVL